jgi:hypothetical protein
MKNLTAILGAVAPTLATAMGGPLGGMALKNGSRQARASRVYHGCC